jgi:hypothetical protein
LKVHFLSGSSRAVSKQVKPSHYAAFVRKMRKDGATREKIAAALGLPEERVPESHTLVWFYMTNGQ